MREIQSVAQPPATLGGAQPTQNVDKNIATKPELVTPDATVTAPEKPSEDTEKKQPDREKTQFELELEARIAALEKEARTLLEQNKNLLDKQQELNTNIDLLSKANHETAETAHNLGEELKAAKDDVELLRVDNERLRTYIATKETQLQPSQTEDYYVQNFRELRTGLEMWIAKQAKTSAATSMSDADASKLLESLAGLGRKGKLSAQYLRLNNTVQKLYCTTGSRIQLIRHVVAVFLFDQIFGPFAVGLPRELSDALEWIDNDILSQGDSWYNWSDLFRTAI